MKLTLFIATLVACLTFGSAFAQTPATTYKPLMVFDATGKVVGHYLGAGRVRYENSTETVEAQVSKVAEGNSLAMLLFTSSNCTGTALVPVWETGFFSRPGQLSDHGLLVYGVGEVSNIIPYSHTLILGDGTLTPCTPFVYDDGSSNPLDWSASPAKIIWLGKPPFTVKQP